MNNLSLITKIAKEILANGGQMYFVGGMVRDQILGKQNKDIDVEIHNICVDAHNVHVGIWNQLQRYINQLTRKPGAAQ